MTFCTVKGTGPLDHFGCSKIRKFEHSMKWMATISKTIKHDIFPTI